MLQVQNRSPRWSALAAALVALAMWTAPAVIAEPGDPVPLSNSPTIALVDMGSGAPLAFYGDQGTATLTFPVPQGLVPVALNATIELPINVASGTLSVTQDDRTIARIPLPPVDQAPIVIPLAGAEIIDNSVTVTLRTYLVPVQGYCLDPTNPLRLVNGSVTFDGVELPPTTVAEFLPPVLRKLTIAIPANPSKVESEAAVRLAAATVAHYGTQATTVAVTTIGSGPAAPQFPFERGIVIQEGPDAGLSLQTGDGVVPALRISGRANELTNQTRLLSSDISRLALSSKAVAGPLRTTAQLPGNVTTLRELGQNGVTAVALAPQVTVGLDQTRLGRSAHNVRVHLMGSYTPVPASVSARLVALVGGETIDSWSTDSGGVLDRWVNVPDRLLQRYTNLGVALNIAGNTGRCGEFQPLTLTIDGGSVVQSTPATPPVPAGFQSLPQSLMPRVQVGIGVNAFDDTVRATTIITGLQRLSSLPIDVAVTDVQTAVNSKLPAVIVAADGWKFTQVTLPVSPTNGRLSLEGLDSAGEPTTLTLDPAIMFGSLQTVFDGQRSILVATSSGAPEQLDELLRWLSSDPRRWSRLTGTALVATPGHSPVTVGPQPGIAEPAPAGTEDRKTWAWALGGGIVAVAAVGTALILVRSRRGESGG
ncbi:cellulose biosynthesis cyclic di-GMP-binding regulatory protein BcsB [Mycobacterium sp. DL592]|uniref:cellulose biosynthesis cyclic di-GMP-binding regulatory protein BcsB n=1 Tax=Mycobacterium sp. DL592 TaxID=2675524 RepID=UPI001FBA6C4D|nr:cellulose biosynthesis cyclic di-GMP-binding regulatory protein BcsB [Mycobacterium sp. DL592]